MKACPIGADSACCKHCSMGPCRLNAKDPYGKVGVCGATIDTIRPGTLPAWWLRRAAHTDHGMGMLDLFREVVNGKSPTTPIKDPSNSKRWPERRHRNRGPQVKEIATDLYKELERTYTQVDGEIPFAKRVPEKTLETWRKLGHRAPRRHARDHGNHAPHPHGRGSALRKHHQAVQPDGPGRRLGRLHGGHRDFRHPVRHPSPVAVDVNMGVLKEDQVNIIVHGHEPNLFESMLESVNEPTLVEGAKDAGAKGINLVGMCCSGPRCCRATACPMPATSCPPRRSWSPAPWMPCAWTSSASSRGWWPRWPSATAPR
jgi:carbon-monoxide dehydrogenase catalytic subunit